MSRYFSPKFDNLTPYTPGEQPRDMTYIKLNTNENPFPPSPSAQRRAKEAAENLQLYSDPTCRELNEIGAKVFGVEADELLFTNGSDEILNFAFLAFCDDSTPAAFADITYGFYSVYADLYNLPRKIIPLREDFSLNADDYEGLNCTIFIANPNAPTGLAIPLADIKKILQGNPNNVVVIDEAYVDFGGESAVSLIHTYDNLLVTRTFSKSRSLAGARLGLGIGCRELIRDLNTIKFSTNPYNINRMTMAAGIGALEDEDYFEENLRQVVDARQWTTQQLRQLGFVLCDSKTNFLFAAHPKLSGGELYQKLREKGILVRHFTAERIAEYNRISIGSRQQMEAFICAVKQILEENL